MDGNRDLTLELFEFSLNNLYQILRGVTESEALIVTGGFPNSILWNAGHIMLTIERFLFAGTNRESVAPPEYMGLFWRGTRPAEWTVEAPKLAGVHQSIEEQMTRMKKEFTGKLNERLLSPMNFPGMQPFNSVGELLGMLLYHEALHVGYIKAILAVIKNRA